MIRNASQAGKTFDKTDPKFILPPNWQDCTEFVDCRHGSSSRWAAGATGRTIDSVRSYSRWLAGQRQLVDRIDELHGRTLVCDCRPLVCHCDVLESAAWLRLQQKRIGAGSVRDICEKLDRCELPHWIGTYKPVRGLPHYTPWKLEAMAFCESAKYCTGHINDAADANMRIEVKS